MEPQARTVPRTRLVLPAGSLTLTQSVRHNLYSYLTAQRFPRVQWCLELRERPSPCPPATTAGQLVVLISATNSLNAGIEARGGSGEHTFDYNAQNAAVSVVGPHATMSFVSDGNRNWFMVNSN